MADISLRFHKDMLVCTTPISAMLARQGADVEQDIEMLTMVEPESLQDAYRMEMNTEAQCLVAETAHLLPARLLHKRMENRLSDLVEASMDLVLDMRAQHVVVELGSTYLPLDPSSKTSLMEIRDQYVRSAREFEKYPFDAYLLSGFSNQVDLQCALMGIRKASDKPVMACIDVAADGTLACGRGTVEEAAKMMEEYGAAVAGIRTAAGPQEAAKLIRRMADVCSLPLMAQLVVSKHNKRQGYPTAENPYFCAETMFDAIPHVRSAGAQFVRAVGDATLAYTGALAAVLGGLDVIDVRGILGD